MLSDTERPTALTPSVSSSHARQPRPPRPFDDAPFDDAPTTPHPRLQPSNQLRCNASAQRDGLSSPSRSPEARGL